MVYSEKGVFKRDTVLRKGKQVNQIRVTGLSVNSKFKDNEELVILSQDEFNKMQNQITTLENQLGEAKSKVESLKDNPPEIPNNNIKVIELQDIINNRNGLLMQTQNTINDIINNLKDQYNKLDKEVTEANNTTKENISNYIIDLQNITTTVLKYSNELETQINNINSEVDKTSWFKWITSKNKFKISMDLDNLKELETQLKDFNNINSITKAKELVTPINIPINKIDELGKDNFNLNNLYIKTDSDHKETVITVTPEKTQK